MTDKYSPKALAFHLFAYWHDPRWKRFVGATVKIWDLAHNLSALGHHVTLFLPRYGFRSPSSSLTVVEVPLLDIPWLRFLSYNILLSLFLTSFGREKRPDVVYARRMGSIVPGIYAKLTRAVFFYEINDDPYRRDFHEGSLLSFNVRKLIAEWQDETNLRWCRKAFVITKEILKKIEIKNPRLACEKLVELPSGANTDLFRPMPAKECRARLHMDLEKSYVGFAGSLLKHQGVDVLIEAAPSILAEKPSTVFVIIGEGPMREAWAEKALGEGIASSFLFAGQVDYEDMPIWIGAMDICVAPFHDSAGLRSPVKIFDYMACGKPVVASRIPGTTDIFDESQAIILVSPGHAQLLARAITGLLGTRDEMHRMGSHGRQFILERFDRRAMARRISHEAMSCTVQGASWKQ